MASISLALLAIPAKAEDTPLRHIIYGGLAWSSDAKYLAVGALDGVWIHNAKDLTTATNFPATFVTALGWRPDAHELAIGDDDGNVHIWNVDTNESQEVISGNRHGYGVDMLQWSPDGHQIALVMAGKIVVWNADQKSQIVIASNLTRDIAYYSVSWDSSSRWIVTLHHNLLRFDAKTGNLNHIWPLNFEGVGTVQRLSPDGQQFVFADYTGVLRIWDMASAAVNGSIDCDDENSLLVTVAWHPDSVHLAGLCGQAEDSEIRIWNSSTLQVDKIITGLRISDGGSNLNKIAWSPQGDRLAAVSEDGKVFIWDAETYQQLAIYSGYTSAFEN